MLDAEAVIRPIHLLSLFLAAGGVGCLVVSRRKARPVRRPAPRLPVVVLGAGPFVEGVAGALGDIFPGQVARGEGEGWSAMLGAPVHLYPQPVVDVIRAAVDMTWQIRSAGMEVVVLGPAPLTPEQESLDGGAFLEWTDALRVGLGRMDHFVDPWAVCGDPGRAGRWAEGVSAAEGHRAVAEAVAELFR